MRSRPVTVGVVLALTPMLLALATAAGALACAGPGGAPEEAPARPAGRDRPPTPDRPANLPTTLQAVVLDERPHDPNAFTQGLLVHDGFLYESTGLTGRSSLRKVDPMTGDVLVQRDLPATIFGEGLALVPSASGGRLIQLTWQDGLAFVWDLERLEQIGEYRYQGEGWGLTFDGERLIMSDGSSTLTFRDPETFEPIGQVEVTLAGHPLARLNELEWVDGRVWANIWGSTTIVEIDPATGKVTATVDLGDLLSRLDPSEGLRIDVLNGIAFQPAAGGDAAGRGDGTSGGDGTFLVTGKLWPRLFEVTFEPRTR